jgi:predicted transcriptional regulator
MTCGEIMTKHIVFCLPEDTVQHAAGLMKEEDVGPVPVVEDRENKSWSAS